MSAGASVREVLEIAAPPDQVWRALTNPDWMAGWLAEQVEADQHAIRLGWGSLGLEVELEVVERREPELLVLRGRPGARPAQTQTVRLAAGGEGGTRVELEHGGFPADPDGDEERAGTRAGWHTQLRVLDLYLTRHAGRGRAAAAAMAPVVAPIDQIDQLLGTREGLSRWLGRLAEPALLDGEGDGFALTTAEGLRLRGAVLAAAPPRQRALAADEIDGVVVLRAIRLTPAARGPVLVGVQAWSWRPERPAWSALSVALDRAVARLCAAAGGATGAGSA